MVACQWNISSATGPEIKKKKVGKNGSQVTFWTRMNRDFIISKPSIPVTCTAWRWGISLQILELLQYSFWCHSIKLCCLQYGTEWFKNDDGEDREENQDMDAAEGKKVVYLMEELAALERRGVYLAKVHTNSFYTVQLSFLEGGHSINSRKKSSK